ncbi:MAG: cupin domain-containing protein [Chloroflexi bacterium]|nr:cupin domain-containing protein [Chloroflexota bacterium]
MTSAGGYDVHDEENVLREAWVRMMKRPRVMKGKADVEARAPVVLFLVRGNGIISFRVRMEAGEAFIMKHGHQYDACFYALEGKGYEIHDGKRYEWEAGDAFYVSPGGCVHQHFNRDPDRPARMLVFMLAPAYTSMNLVADGNVAFAKGVTQKKYHDSMLLREGADA